VRGAVEVSAPGKLVLIGEYAVLHGSPAVAAAVDRRAVVRAVPVEDGRWLVTAPGIVEGPAGAAILPGGVFRWEDPEAGNRLGLVEAVVRGFAALRMVDPARLPALELHLDTTAFFHPGRPDRPKLGLGSSAALTVALAMALAAAGGEGPPTPPSGGWLAALVRLHRTAQGGGGSGIDVAASLLGGVVRYRLGGGGRPKAAPLVLPHGLHLRFVWVGRPARTADFLARLQDALEADRPGPRARLEAMSAMARRGVEALETGAVGRFVQAAAEYAEAMRGLGEALGLPIVSPEHEALSVIARKTGAAYKPSGAGGGDFGVAFAEDPAALDRFSGTAREAGFEPMDLPVAAEGASLRIDAL